MTKYNIHAKVNALEFLDVLSKMDNLSLVTHMDNDTLRNKTLPLVVKIDKKMKNIHINVFTHHKLIVEVHTEKLSIPLKRILLNYIKLPVLRNSLIIEQYLHANVRHKVASAIEKNIQSFVLNMEIPKEKSTYKVTMKLGNKKYKIILANNKVVRILSDSIQPTNNRIRASV